MRTNQRVSKLFGKTKQSEQIPKTIVSIMKYFGWTLEEVKALPVPSFKVLCEIININEEEAEEKTKNKR